jgi:hypothetical protein
LDYSAEATPPGRWTINQVAPTVPSSDGNSAADSVGLRKPVGWLAHSTSYQEPNALASVTEWLRQAGLDDLRK